MKTVASIFGGFGGFEYGAMAAGLKPVWTVECDPAIALFYSRNVGAHALVARAEDVDYSRLERPDWLHMSPVCTNASVAKKDGRETEADREMARACARAITSLMPDEVSLENVWNYRNFDSFRIVTDALTRCGYYFNFWHLNAADYGVPQTRKRLILLTSTTHRPRRPTPTHSQLGASAQQDLFGASPMRKWEGWYKAIEDLIPTLPESKFAEWQLKRLSKGLCDSTVVEATAAGVDNKFTMPARSSSEPIFTVRPGPNIPRAFILSNSKTEFSDGVRESDRPMLTVTTQHKGRLRAFIVDCQDAGTPDESGERNLTIREDDEPTFTVSASMNRRPARAWLSQGRVVSMTPRALARFQSIPDSVVLPEHNGLACKVIGNAVPSLLARRMVESRMEAIRRAA